MKGLSWLQLQIGGYTKNMDLNNLVEHLGLPVLMKDWMILRKEDRPKPITSNIWIQNMLMKTRNKFQII